MRSYHIKRRDCTRWHAGNYPDDTQFLKAHPWAKDMNFISLDIETYPRAARINPKWDF